MITEIKLTFLHSYEMKNHKAKWGPIKTNTRKKIRMWKVKRPGFRGKMGKSIQTGKMEPRGEKCSEITRKNIKKGVQLAFSQHQQELAFNLEILLVNALEDSRFETTIPTKLNSNTSVR